MMEEKWLFAFAKNVGSLYIIAMINRDSRNKLYKALHDAALGRITSFDCENLMLSLPTDDGVVKAMLRTVRYMVEDDNCSLNHLFTKESGMRHRLSRWLLFLKSNCKYEWPEIDLPAGILDFYLPSLIDRITGLHKSIQCKINNYNKAGNYVVWPFISINSFNKSRKIRCKGLRLLD